MIQQAATQNDSDAVLTTDDVLLEEFAAIACDDWADGKPPRRSQEWLHANAADLRAVA
jgi:hypothetical protein